jgi:hypothetical protein
MMHLLTSLLLASFLIGFDDKSIDLGAADQKKPPAKEDLKPPKESDKVDTVDLHAKTTGKIDKEEKRKVYVLVNPLSNDGLRDVWWVQEAVTRDGADYHTQCRFGDDSAGRGEFFAIVGMATDKAYTVGEQLKSIPTGGAYTKMKIVRRSKD